MPKGSNIEKMNHIIANEQHALKPFILTWGRKKNQSQSQKNCLFFNANQKIGSTSHPTHTHRHTHPDTHTPGNPIIPLTLIVTTGERGQQTARP